MFSLTREVKGQSNENRPAFVLTAHCSTADSKHSPDLFIIRLAIVDYAILPRSDSFS